MLRFKRVMGLVITTSIVSTSLLGINPVKAATNTKKSSVAVKKVVVKKVTVDPNNLSKAGTSYGSNSASKPLTYKGDVKITAKGVKLSNAVINGNLYISGDKVTLQNVTVAKVLTIEGANVTLNGNFSRIEVKKPSTVNVLKGTKINTFVAMANVNLITNQSSRINKLYTKGNRVKQSGKGIIVYKNGYLVNGVKVNPVASKVIKMNSITLSKTALTLDSGASAMLSAAIDPENATDQDLYWSSNNPSLVSVNNGFIVANNTGKTGTAIITVTNSDEDVFASCAVTVNPVAVTGISSITTSTGANDVALNGDALTLTANVTPSNATNKAVTWTSSDESIATVTSTGDNTASVAGLKLGNVTITATTKDGSKVASISLTVKPIAVSGITLDKTSLAFVLGDAPYTLAATVAPSNATDKGVSWTSSNTNIATVDASGKVTAVGFGTAKITAVSVADSTKIATCDVTVNMINNSDVYGDNTLAGIAFTVIVTPTNGIDSSNVSVDYTLSDGSKNTKAADAGLTNGKITVSIPEDLSTVKAINVNVSKNGYIQTINLDPTSIK